MRHDYNIAFIQLSKGAHQFRLLADNSFFAMFPEGMVKEGNVDVLLVLVKNEGLFTLDFSWDGWVLCQCDNCLVDIRHKVKNKAFVTVKIQHEPAEDEPDLIYLSPNAQTLDVKQMVYDFIVLDLPMRKLCENDISGNKKCNTKVAELIKNKEAEKETDSRWDKLKTLLKKDNYGSPEA